MRPMRLLTSDIKRAGRDAGSHHVWWRRASVPAIITCMKARWTVGVGFIPARLARPEITGGDNPRPYTGFWRQKRTRHEVGSILRRVWDEGIVPRFYMMLGF